MRRAGAALQERAGKKSVAAIVSTCGRRRALSMRRRESAQMDRVRAGGRRDTGLGLEPRAAGHRVVGA